MRSNLILSPVWILRVYFSLKFQTSNLTLCNGSKSLHLMKTFYFSFLVINWNCHTTTSHQDVTLRFHKLCVFSLPHEVRGIPQMTSWLIVPQLVTTQHRRPVSQIRANLSGMTSHDNAYTSSAAFTTLVKLHYSPRTHEHTHTHTKSVEGKTTSWFYCPDVLTESCVSGLFIHGKQNK